LEQEAQEKEAIENTPNTDADPNEVVEGDTDDLSEKTEEMTKSNAQTESGAENENENGEEFIVKEFLHNLFNHAIIHKHI